MADLIGYSIRNFSDEILGLFLTKLMFKNLDIHKWHSFLLIFVGQKAPGRHTAPERGIKHLLRSQDDRGQDPLLLPPEAVQSHR